MFTERQLKILIEALEIGRDHYLLTFGKWWEVDALKSDLDDMLENERRQKRERKKSLAIERRAASNH